MAFVIGCNIIINIVVTMLFSLGLIYNFIYESPRYLVAQRMYDEARYVLSKMAKINGRPHFYYKFENE